MKKYISEIIGSEYMNWNPGDKYMVNAPTGSGKTSFIIDTLFPYAIKNGRKILYLCNRKTLRDQFLSRIGDKIRVYLAQGYSKVGTHIEVRTYQEIETYCKNSNSEWLYEQLKGFYYIICDEAHYFLSDSLFNNDTILSYRFINRLGLMEDDLTLGHKQKIVVFISATGKRLRECLGEIESTVSYEDKPDIPYRDVLKKSAKEKIENMKVYSGEKDYSYLSIKAFHFDASIIPLIQQDKLGTKWLIFINDLKKGNKLVKDLEKEEIDAVFIDAKYESIAEAKQVINELSENEFTKHRVLVTTSVLYNGISIHDLKLRNLIIFADNEEDFIQMIGRKRDDGEKVNVYISSQSAEVFKRRLVYLEKTQQTIDWTMNYALLRTGMLMAEMFKDPSTYAKIRQYLTVITDIQGVGGYFYPNFFSIAEISNRVSHYKTLISRFESEGENAFIKTQMEWLGKSEDDLICIDDGSEKEIYRQKLIKKLDEWVGRDFSDEENKKEFLPSIREEVRKLLKLYNPEDRKKLDENVRKNDRVISLDTFNGLMGIFSLGYKMLGGGDSKVFKIIKN